MRKKERRLQDIAETQVFLSNRLAQAHNHIGSKGRAYFPGGLNAELDRVFNIIKGIKESIGDLRMALRHPGSGLEARVKDLENAVNRDRPTYEEVTAKFKKHIADCHPEEPADRLQQMDMTEPYKGFVTMRKSAFDDLVAKSKALEALREEPEDPNIARVDLRCYTAITHEHHRKYERDEYIANRLRHEIERDVWDEHIVDLLKRIESGEKK